MQRLLIFMIVFITGCHQSSDVLYEAKDFKLKGKGVLLTTRFNSFEEFKKEVQVEYSKDEKSWVRITQNSNNQIVSSILKSGVKESDIVAIRDGGLIGKIKLVLTAPYFVTNRNDILRVYMLTRRRHRIFGGGDIAFFDIAKTMMRNINSADLRNIPEEDLSEKGYINTFNHANSQALMTAIFSEQLADFIADTHERSNMPELITGKFTDVQIADIKNGPVDNYVDIINNEGRKSLEELKHTKVLLITGIADPSPMEEFLARNHISFEHLKFGDHQFIGKTEIQVIRKKLSGLAEEEKIIITTEIKIKTTHQA